jgi:hypothetical protein
MKATIFIWPEQRGQISGSTSYSRSMSMAQVWLERLRAAAGPASPLDDTATGSTAVAAATAASAACIDDPCRQVSVLARLRRMPLGATDQVAHAEGKQPAEAESGIRSFQRMLSRSPSPANEACWKRTRGLSRGS